MGRSLLTRFYYIAGVLLILIVWSLYFITGTTADYSRADIQEDARADFHHDLFAMGFYLEAIESDGLDNETVLLLTQALQDAEEDLQRLNLNPLPTDEYEDTLNDVERSFKLLKTFAQGVIAQSTPETEQEENKVVHDTVQAIDGQLENLDRMVAAELTVLVGQVTLALFGGLLFYLALLIASVVWLYRILRRVRTVQEGAAGLAEGHMETRLVVSGSDEISHISETFNLMAERVGGRVESLLSGIRERTRALEASQRITLAASERLSPEELLSLIVNLIRDQFNLYHVQVYLVDEEAQAAMLRDSTGYAGRQLLQKNHQIPLDQSSLVTHAIHQRKAVLVADVTKEESFLANPLLPDTRAELVMPMIVANRVIGALDIQSSEHGTFTPPMVTLFESLTKQVSLLFENSDLVDRVSHQSEVLVLFANQLRTAAELAGQLNSFLEIDELLTQTVNLLKERFNLYQAHIYLLDESGGQLLLRAASGESGAQMLAQGFAIPLEQEQSLVAQAARTQEVVLVEDVHQEPTFLPHALLPETHSEVTIPLVTANRVLGVLDLQTTQEHTLTQADLDVFKTLAGQIASALENARLFQQVERNLKEARVRYAVSQALAGIKSEEEVLDALLEQASGYPNTHTTLFLVDQSPEMITLITHGSKANGEGLVAVPEGTRFDSNTIPTVKYIASPEPFVTQNAAEDERVDPAALEIIRATGSVSIAAIPLFVEGEQVASLSVTSPVAGHFDEEKFFFYRSLVEQGEIALHAARLRAATEQARAEAELERSLLDGILNNLPVGVYVTDTNMQRVRVNELADRMFERGPGLANSSFNFIHADTGEPYADELRPLYRTIQDGQSHQAADIAVRFEDGHLVNLLVNSGPLLDSSGKVMGAITALSDITAHKRAEEALAQANEQLQEELIKRQQTEDRFRAIAEAIPIPIVITTTTTGVVQYANQQISTMFGLTLDEVIGQQAPNYYQNPADRKQMIDELARKGYLQNYEVAMRKVDGTPFWAAVSIQPLIFDEQRSILVAFYDLTARREAEAARRASEERFRSLIQNSSDVISILAADGTILYESPSVERILGYQPEELVGQNAFGLIHPDDIANVVSVFGETVERGNDEEQAHIEFRYLHKDGSWKLLEAIGTALLNDPSIQGIVVNSRDITERRRAADALREQRAFLNQIINAIPSPIFVKDWEGKYLLANQELANMSGIPIEDILDKTDAELFPGFPDTEEFKQADREVMSSLQPKFIPEERAPDIRHNDLRWFQTTKVPLTSPDGSSNQVLGVATDITARKQAEQALEAQRSFLRQIVDATPGLLFVKDWEGNFVLANSAFANLYGTTTETLVGKSDFDFNSNLEEVQGFLEADRQVMTSLEPVFIPEELVTEAGGTSRWFQMIKVPLTAPDGKSNQVLGVGTDITERKQVEQALAIRLRYEEGLAACSQALLAGETFHEAMNQALAALLHAANVNRVYLFEKIEEPAEGTFLRQRHEVCAPGTVPQLNNAEMQKVPIAGPMSEWVTQLTAGQPAGGILASLSPEIQELLAGQDIVSLINLPIFLGKEWYGLIGFDDTESARVWGEEEIRLLQTASDMIGNYIERTRAEEALAERARLATFDAEISQALTQGTSLQQVLQRCTQAMVDHLDAAFARIWTLNPRENMLELQASAGMYTHLDGPHGRVPVGKFKIGLIAEEKEPHLTNSVQTDPRVGDKAWATEQGLLSFAGHPLILDGEVVGVMAMFAHHPLTDFTGNALASTANTIA
nr:PAS domain S-box protein [Ardenticatenales bacterium]